MSSQGFLMGGFTLFPSQHACFRLPQGLGPIVSGNRPTCLLRFAACREAYDTFFVFDKFQTPVTI